MSSSFLRSLMLGRPPLYRRFLLIAVDAILLPSAVWMSFWLRLANPLHPSFFSSGPWLLIAVLLVGLPLYAFTGQYKGLTRYVGSAALYRLACRNGLLVLCLVSIGVLFSLPLPPRSSWILLWFLLTCLTGAVRFALRDVLLNLRSTQHKTQLRVAIYGAGESGAQLAAALRLTGNHKNIIFLDDNPAFWNRSINGVPIQPPQVLNDLKDSIDQVLLAIPSLSRRERRYIVERLQGLGFAVFQVPSVDDLTSGRARIDALRPITIEDLLGRDEVPADPQLLGPGIRDSVVCVSGAGGSIGSELCRQILSLSPARLILLERSEPALYSIDQELRSLLCDDIQLQSVLGSATDQQLLQRLFVQKMLILFSMQRLTNTYHLLRLILCGLG